MHCMKRLAAIVAVGLAWPCPAFAQSPSQPSVTTTYPQNQVGVVAAVKGSVEVTSPGAVGRIVDSGQPIFIGDAVKTGPQGRLQILLFDETIFTIGPDSAIVIDEFVYDPSTDAGKVSAEILKGVFRFVTGKVAHKKPENMKVKLPAGTIGVRGTIVAGRVDGQRSSVTLIGPGSVVVSNMVNNAVQEVSVSRIGFGTVIAGPEAPPTPPSFVPPAQLAELMSAF